MAEKGTPMLDFGALPPEINSARMYSGPGSGPIIAAASAWDALAAQLGLYAAGYSSVLSDLQGQNWSGGASIAMASAAGPYVAWATTTAAQAEQAAGQARAAAAAYEAAFAATVPPEVVAANRILSAMLVATNFFGQNTMAIAAAEAAYAEMWAQDAAAMYGYAASSSAATALTPFTQPPQTTNAGGESAQAAVMAQAAASSAGHTQLTLSQLISTLPHQLQTLATAGSSDSSTSPGSTLLNPSSILTTFSDFNTRTGPAFLGSAFSITVTSAGRFGTGLYRSDIQSGPNELPFSWGGTIGAKPSASGGVRGLVLARMGQAAPVGKLAVPQSWVAANPVASPANGPVPLSGTDPRAVPAAGANPPTNTLGGIPMAGTERRPVGSLVLRNGRRAFKMPHPVFGG
jgi:PPE-repeat protein